MVDEIKVEKDELKVVGKVEIFMLSDGGVSVTGPLKNPVLMMEIFSKAMGGVVTYATNEAEKEIVVPKKNIVSLN